MENIVFMIAVLQYSALIFHVNQEPGSDASLRNLIASVKRRNSRDGETVAETAVIVITNKLLGMRVYCSKATEEKRE